MGWKPMPRFASRFAAVFANLGDVRRMFAISRANLALWLLLAWAPAIEAAMPERSVSSSRQFIVYGDDVRLRGAICDLAEQAKRDLLRLLEQRDEWATPIVVHAQYPQTNLPETPRSALNFGQTGFGLKLQLDLTIAPDLRRVEIQRELLRAILLEIIYRYESNVPAGTAYVSPPDWLLAGLLAQQSGRGRCAAVLAAPVATQRIVLLEEFLRQRPDLLDALGRSLYEAYSFVLLDLLVQAPDGRRRLARFIAGLPAASSDPFADLRTHFPELAREQGKIWSAHVTQLSRDQPDQLLGAAETDRTLEELLHLKILEAGVEKKYPLEDFAKCIGNPSAKPALAALTLDLIGLGTRANPIYRRILADYAEITTLLARGKTKGIAARLARASSSRKIVAARTRAIDDYMNWYEATKSRGLSGAFAEYMKAAEAAARPEQTRRDPISVYLDVLETQFQN
jgi:hypothetical protein